MVFWRMIEVSFRNIVLANQSYNVPPSPIRFRQAPVSHPPNVSPHFIPFRSELSYNSFRVSSQSLLYQFSFNRQILDRHT